LRIAKKLMKLGTYSDKYSALNYRPPLYHPDFPVVVMWSQKSACTIAVKWFFHHLGLLDEALDHHRWIHNYENDVFKARTGYLDECRAAIEAGTQVIKFVRNPLERAFSGYLETCNRRVLSDSDHWSTRVRGAVLSHLTGGQQPLEYTYSFNQFCDWLASQCLEALDPHLAPQWEAVENMLSVQAVRIDDPGNAFLRVEEEFGLPSSAGMKKVHSSPHHHRKVTKPDADIVRLMHLGIPVQRDRSFEFYDATSAAIAKSDVARQLAALYRTDFDAYGYQLAL